MSILRSTVFLTFATFLSRVLGLIRDILFARVLGGGVLMSAWSLASQAPNIFRRILGEGALGSALIPILTERMEKDGVSAARSEFSTVVIWLFFLLVLITVIFSGGALIAYEFAETERWKLALLTIPVIMPYCILICSIGVFTSVLNTFRLFFLPAIMGLLPNLFLIGATFFFLPELMDSPVRMLRTVSVALLLSGVLELLILAVILKWNGMLPQFSRETLCNFTVIKEVWDKVLPGIIGASALQIGTLTDSWLAMFVGDYAKAAMYYSDRLVYLPIGLFAVSFGTVSLPVLSKFIAEGRVKTMLISTFTSIRQMMFITIPMTVIILLFARELLAFFFSGGKFDERALEESWQAMFWFSFGIPFFCLTKLTVNTFYCRKDMRTPAAVSVICIGLNIILSVILMFPMRQGGITFATALTSILNNAILLTILRKKFGRMPFKGTAKFSLIILLLSLISGAVARFVYEWDMLQNLKDLLPRNIVPLCGAGGCFVLVYIGLAALFRIHELNILIKQIRRKLIRK